MKCMKCGREMTEDLAFCSTCLAEMEQFPVRPGTVILLPNREPSQPRKPVRKKKAILSADELIPVLKRKVWTLRLISLVLALLLTVISIIAIQAVTELDWQRLLGQNYSTIDSAEPGSTQSR